MTCQSQQTTPIQSKPSPALHLFSFKKRFTWIQYLNHKWACHLTQIITPAGDRSAYYEGKYKRAWKIDVIWLYYIDFCSCFLRSPGYYAAHKHQKPANEAQRGFLRCFSCDFIAVCVAAILGRPHHLESCINLDWCWSLNILCPVETEESSTLTRETDAWFCERISTGRLRKNSIIREKRQILKTSASAINKVFVKSKIKSCFLKKRKYLSMGLEN